MTLKALIIDIDRCTGCMSCVLACSLAKEGKFDPRRSRIRVYKDESRCLAIPIVCEQCKDEEPPCMEACPTGAIARNAVNGIVEVYSDTCAGCRACVDACPYAGIVMDPGKNVALMCDLCGRDPECAKVCVPVRAIQYVECDETMLRKKTEFAENRVKVFASFTLVGA